MMKNENQNKDNTALRKKMERYADMGMHREALKLARRILRRRYLTAEDLQRTVCNIFSMQDRIRTSIAPIERAYQRLSQFERKKARDTMLSAYMAVGEKKKAVAFATIRPRDASDFMFSLEAFDAMKRTSAVNRLVRWGYRALKRPMAEFDQNCIRKGLADYVAGKGWWSSTIELLWEAPLDHAFCSKFSSMVTAYAAMALDIIDRGLRDLSKLDRKKSGLEIEHPGLDNVLVADERRDLLRFRKALKRIIPKK